MAEGKYVAERRKVPIATIPRLVLAGVCIAFFLGGGIVGWTSMQPVVTQEDTLIYSYQFTADGTYQVVLTPNELYAQERLGEGQFYPLSMTDRVDIFLSATCDATTETVFDGYYSVSISLLGYQSNDGTQMLVYEKIWPLVEQTAFQSAGTHMGISDSVTLNPAEYQEFATTADLLLGTRVAKQLTLVFEGEVSILSAEETATEAFSYAMTMPADAALYTIAKQSPYSGSGRVAQTHEVITNAGFTPITGLAILAGAVGLLGLLAIGLFTRKPTVAERSELLIRNALRKHGSRMVRLDAPPVFPSEHLIYVSDLDSLIRVADERQRPVFYVLGPEHCQAGTAFYVLDANAVYLLQQQGQQTEMQHTTLVVDAVP